MFDVQIPVEPMTAKEQEIAFSCADEIDGE